MVRSSCPTSPNVRAMTFVGLLAAACSGGADSASTSATGPSSTGGESATSTSGPTTASTSAGGSQTGTSTTTGGGSSTSGGSGGFIAPPDGGVEGMCDPIAQDCPEGEKCTAYSTDGPKPPAAPWNANKCVPVTGDGQEGDPCDIEGGKYTGLDNCDVGLVCLLTDDDGKGGACVSFCKENMTCDNPNAECAVYNDGSLPICLLTCDPLLQDCPQGQGCYASAGGSGFICFKFSGGPGEGGPGAECNYVNACQPGTACLAPESVEGCGAQAGCCSPYCDLTDPDPASGCNPTEQCVPWFDMGMAPPGFEDVGVCAIPQ